MVPTTDALIEHDSFEIRINWGIKSRWCPGELKSPIKIRIDRVSRLDRFSKTNIVFIPGNHLQICNRRRIRLAQVAPLDVGKIRFSTSRN